jgi:hypothetical protein
MCLLPAPSAADCKRTCGVARVSGAATGADARVAAGSDQTEQRPGRRADPHVYLCMTAELDGEGDIRVTSGFTNHQPPLASTAPAAKLLLRACGQPKRTSCVKLRAR